MAFPNIDSYPDANVGPYERQMGDLIAKIVMRFTERLPDVESQTSVLRLAKNHKKWSAAHAVWDELRKRFREATASKDFIRAAQYCFEESCCSALYNATDPEDPFDPSSAFFVLGYAAGIAKLVDLPLEDLFTEWRTVPSHGT